MPTKTQIKTAELRAKVVEQHGDRCLLCNAGPLRRCALHLNRDIMAKHGHVPLCKKCAEAAAGRNFEKYLTSVVKRHARAYDRSVSALMDLYPNVPVPVPQIRFDR